MARTLDQIIKELDPTFSGQRKTLNDRANLIPGQIKSEEAGLQAKQGQAFNQILGGARQRGLGFSGIPLGEQAQYTATEFLPAIARLRQSGREQAMSLQDAILGINERRDTLGQQIFQGEQDRAAQERQAAQARAAQAAATFGAFNSLGLGGQGGEQASTRPRIERTQNGGFNFFDAFGEPVNAAEYVALNNQSGGQLGYRELLSKMAKDGDRNAAVALRYVGDDGMFGNAPSQFRGALGALGAQGQFTDPAAAQSFRNSRTNSQPRQNQSFDRGSNAGLYRLRGL